MHDQEIPPSQSDDVLRSSPTESGRLLSRGVAYTLSVAGPKAIQLLTLPLFTLAMSAAEFGRMALAVTVTLAVVPLLTRNLETAVFRSWYALADDEAERRRYLSTAAVSLFVFPNVVALLVLVLALPYTATSDLLPTSYLALALFGSSLLVSATVVSLGVLRAQDRLRDFLRVSLVGPAISIPLTVVAVVGLELGARGWLAANLVGAMATLPVAAFALRDQWTRRLSRRHLRSLVNWAVPFVPHGIAHWTLATSDRVILASYVSLADLGVYNVGYQLALALALLFSALNNVFSSDYGRAINDPVHRARLPRLVTYQVLLTGSFGLVVALLAPPAIAVALPEQFEAAQAVVPWVALGYVFYGLYFVPMNRIVILGGDVGRVWIPTSIAAVTSVGLNLVFVPSGGILAAAVVTAASYLVLLLAMALYGQRHHAMPGGIEWRTLALSLGGLGALFGLLVLTSPEDPALALCWRLGCMIACCLAIVVLVRRARARTG